MKLLNIALFSTLSLNAFADTPAADIANPEVSSSPKIFSQISPTTHKVFLVSKLAQAAWNLCVWKISNNAGLAEAKLEGSESSFNPASILEANLHGVALIYIRQHLFAMSVEEKIHSQSQPPTEHHYMHLVKNGALGLTHAYFLITTAYRTYQSAQKTTSRYYYSNLLGWMATFACNAATAGLEYKTIRALEDPKNHKVPTWLKTTLNATTLLKAGLSLSSLYNQSPTLILGSLITTANLVTQTLFTNQLVTAAERHIAAQQSQA